MCPIIKKKKKEVSRNRPRDTQMLELADKYIRETIINIFKDLMEKMIWLSKQMRNLSRNGNNEII